ncbi:hypothetical protein QJS66_10545 [Kocuria rhizophila]|nr:hypothetical protein QJS66_10545 [Kocuria rhizophila]
MVTADSGRVMGLCCDHLYELDPRLQDRARARRVHASAQGRRGAAAARGRGPRQAAH